MSDRNALFARRQRRTRYALRQAAGGRPRLSVFRSGKHIYAQVIDDRKGLTLAAASSLDKLFNGLLDISKLETGSVVPQLEAVKHTLDRIAGAIVATTIILCAGVVIVIFSDLPQVALFGTLFVSTLAFALIGDLFILPALLAAGGKFFQPLGRIRVGTADHDATPDDPMGDTLTGDGGTEGHSTPV